MEITEMKNLASCESFILEGDEIFCSVNANDLYIKIEDRDNINIDWREYFIIRQNLSQVSNQDYQVVNKAPISEPEILFSIDDNFIFINSTDNTEKIIDINNGLMRDMFVDLYSYEKIESDAKLIFQDFGSAYYIEENIGKIPKIYRENNSIEEKKVIQECNINESNSSSLSQNDFSSNSNYENLPIKLVKWENNDLSFEYNDNEFFVTETTDKMVHLKDKTDNLNEYANVSVYKIDDGLTLDVIFDNIRKMGEEGGYYDVTKKKIGNRDFIVYFYKKENGEDVSMNYETVINNKYRLNVGNNFFYHKRNTESINKIEKIIELIQVKN